LTLCEHLNTQTPSMNDNVPDTYLTDLTVSWVLMV